MACKRLDKRATSVNDRASAQEGPSDASKPAEEPGSTSAKPSGKGDTDARCATEAVRESSASGSAEGGFQNSSEVESRAGLGSAAFISQEERGQGGDAERMGEAECRGEESGRSTGSERGAEPHGECRNGGAASSSGMGDVTRETGDVTERVAALDLDDAGFPASPVDWETGSEPLTGAGSVEESGVHGAGSKETGDSGHGSGGQARQADVTSGSGRQGDVSDSPRPQHSGPDASGAGPSGQARDGSESVSKNGTGTTQRGNELGGRLGKGGTAELTAVVKPRALDPKLWPELEISVESEADYEGESETGVSGRVNGGLGDVSALLEQYGRRVEKKREFSEEDLEEAEAGMRDMGGDKKQWAAFEARLAAAPEQVLR